MTDQAKLQQLFDAALKDSSEIHAGAPKRAFPGASYIPKPHEETHQPNQSFTPTVAAEPEAPVASAVPVAPTAVCNESKPVAEMPVEKQVIDTPQLDPEASAEMAAIIDEKEAKAKRSRRIQSIVTACILLSGSAGASLWVVQSPDRVQAFRDAIRDIRSVGDIPAMVAKFQDSLDRISARGQQIDQATAAMGVVSDGTEEDQFFDAEMKEMMGSEGKTIGDRNRAMMENFGNMAEENGTSLANSAAPLEEGESFEW